MGRTITRCLENSVAALAREKAPFAPLVIGISAPQGSGKSTLAAALKANLFERGHSVAVLSLDDFYLDRLRRQSLAREIHPLLATRGVPGTHDISLGIRTLTTLCMASETQITLLPKFDKARDEPCPDELWEQFRGRPDIILFEGWCLGATPETEEALSVPINKLERDEDENGIWRRYVNQQLADTYPDLFRLVHKMAYLRPPNFEIVFKWRGEQESMLPPNARMGEHQLHRFIMHYERLTRHLMAEMPTRADLVATLGAMREVISIHQECSR